MGEEKPLQSSSDSSSISSLVSEEEKEFDTITKKSFSVGMVIDVYWAGDDLYYRGKITKESRDKKRVFVQYEDGEEEWMDPYSEDEKIVVVDCGGWREQGLFFVF